MREGIFIAHPSKAEFWLIYWALALLYQEQQGSEWGKRQTTLRAKDLIGGEPTLRCPPKFYSKLAPG